MADTEKLGIFGFFHVKYKRISLQVPTQATRIM